MEIIVPCCGMSTRFPGTRPKFLLVDYDNKFMIEKAIEPFVLNGSINIVVLKEHVEKYNFIKRIQERAMVPLNFVILDHPTQGPADTVYQAIKKMGLSKEPIFIKDCDSYFDPGEFEDGNFVCIENASNAKKDVSNKSFVVANSQGIISSIVEKHVVSDQFCVGGYQFSSASHFVGAFENPGRRYYGHDLMVSDVIALSLDRGIVFVTKTVSGYVDVGTLQDWLDYNDKPTIFCDIDGVLVKNQSSLTGFQNPIPLENNVKTLKKHLERGCTLVFTTARGNGVYEETRSMLDDLGFESCHLLMGINRGKRVIVNDYHASNPYPAAIAINVKQDEDFLNILLPVKGENDAEV